jgi:amino acid efflux transporter
VRAGFGEAAAAVTGGWFLCAIVLGAPAVSLMGGYYVADLTGAGPTVAVVVAVCMFSVVLGANALGLRVSSSMQLALSSALLAVLVVAIAVVIPERGGKNWQPFAPHGWWAVGMAANILIWLFVGWEAVAQFAGDFSRPSLDVPRAVALAFAIVTILYVSLAVATVGATGSSPSRVPLADLVSIGFGRAGRDVTAVLAVALTIGTMNVYMGGAAKLAVALADAGAVPRWLGHISARGVPVRPLAFFAAFGVVLLGALAGGFFTITDLIRATSSLFVGIYVLSIASAVRILRGKNRLVALAAVIMVTAVAAFAGWYALVPAVSAAIALVQWAYFRRLVTIRDRAPTAASVVDSWRRP